jgi:hypothetical protein
MRLKFIGCKVLYREVGLLSSSCHNFIDITWLRQGYHDEPEILRKTLQEEIDRIDTGNDPYSCNTEYGDFDAIVLGYGLCSNGIIGLSSKKYPIVVPRAHDCISLFLGSKERYRTLFDEKSGGIYWYTSGWIENSLMPSEERYMKSYNIYAEHYGEENAEYLMEMESGWLKEYKCLAYIQMPGIDVPNQCDFSKRAAGYLGWEYIEHSGDYTLLKDLLDGKWDEDKFLIIPKGGKIEPSFDEGIIKLCE